MMRIILPYEISDRVIIDGDRSVVGTVIAYAIRGLGKNVTVQVSWVQDGNLREPWIGD